MSHADSKSDKCESRVIFNINQALLLSLQKTTNLQTHEIMNIIAKEHETMMTDYEIILDKKSTAARWTFNKSYSSNRVLTSGYWRAFEVKKRKTITFPNTEILMVFNMSATWYRENWEDYSYKPEEKKFKVKANTLVITTNINVPQRTIKYEADDLNMILMEGDLLDQSSDIEDLDQKDTITPAVKREREAIRQLKKKNKEKEKATKKFALSLEKEQKAFNKALNKMKKEKVIQ